MIHSHVLVRDLSMLPLEVLVYGLLQIDLGAAQAASIGHTHHDINREIETIRNRIGEFLHSPQDQEGGTDASREQRPEPAAVPHS